MWWHPATSKTCISLFLVCCPYVFKQLVMLDLSTGHVQPTVQRRQMQRCICVVGDKTNEQTVLTRGVVHNISAPDLNLL